MQSTIAPLLDQFSARPTAVKDELRTYAECDPAGFLKEVLPVIRSSGDAQVRLYLVHLLLKSRLLLEYLVDPSQSGLEDAVAVAKTIRDLGVLIISGIESFFVASLKDKSAGAIVIRLMQLSRALSLDKLIMQFQEELIAHADMKVRSKDALEIGRAEKRGIHDMYPGSPGSTRRPRARRNNGCFAPCPAPGSSFAPAPAPEIS